MGDFKTLSGIKINQHLLKKKKKNLLCTFLKYFKLIIVTSNFTSNFTSNLTSNLDRMYSSITRGLHNEFNSGNLLQTGRGDFKTLSRIKINQHLLKKKNLLCTFLKYFKLIIATSNFTSNFTSSN